MGIPRLTQDVMPFIESVILGEVTGDIDILQMNKVVVDGPSLVYHVCNKILLFNGAISSKVAPTYTQINACLMQFLTDVESCGVEISRIFFDGRLPIRKRGTREERLEKTRYQLENARRLLLNPPTQQSLSKNGFDAKCVWSSYPVHARSPFPHPPFMVASAIEFLENSRWKNSICVMPGEADPFCASYASIVGAAVLSNDSDLLLFDLKEAAVLPLHDLQLNLLVSGKSYVRAQCFRPNHIAKRLGVRTLLEYGFCRYEDASATSSVIAERSKKCDEKMKDSASWRQFCSEYWTMLSGSATTLHDLDPRVAELVVSLEADEDLHSYLPILIEDHDRDSSWSYGIHIRQIAYSVLCRCRESARSFKSARTVNEYARKGGRIVSTQLVCHSTSSTLEELEELVALHKLYNTTRSITSETVFFYYILATHIVIKKRMNDSKDFAIVLWKLFESIPTVKRNLDWDDIHFLANIQAVLYSIRMLHQILSHTLQRHPIGQSPDKVLKSLSEKLRSLPSIQDLFLNHQEWYSILEQMPSQQIKARITQMLANLTQRDNTSVSTQPNPSMTSKSAPQEWTAVSTHSPPVINNKRRKKNKNTNKNANNSPSNQPPTPDISSTKPTSLTDSQRKSTNPFFLLQTD